ncbi:MAG: KH domain-containing protein [Actinomycetota bacterium]
MCGIVAIVSRPSTRSVPVGADLLALLDRAVASHVLSEAAVHVAEVDRLLHGVPGVLALIDRHELVAGITSRLDQLEGRVALVDRQLETDNTLTPDDIEAANAELLALRDAVWAVRRDRLRTAHAVAAFAGRDAGRAAVAGYLSVQQALSAIDRMEVRGRDSAGVHVFVAGHHLDPAGPAVRALVARRCDDPLFQSGSVRWAQGCLSLVYKAAAEIGELGDNVKALRAAVQADELLRLALTSADARVSVLGHTRWASVGIISEPNCHPVNGEQSEMSAGDELPYTSTVVIDKFEEEAGRGKQKRLLRIAATIVVERDTHKAMVIGDKGERIKRIGTETRVELEKALDAKVFIELWVKVRSGWADDEARVRSFGYQ